MWLLDANMPARLCVLLEEFSIQAATGTIPRLGCPEQWRILEAAASAGFSCLLTRDRLFGESASRLEVVPQFSIVVVNLSQLRERAEQPQCVRAGLS